MNNCKVCSTISKNKRFQVVFVELRTQKPVVEILRGLGKAKNRGQEEGDRGQDGQHDADAAQGQANAAQNEKNQPFYVHAVYSNAKIPGKLVSTNEPASEKPPCLRLPVGKAPKASCGRHIIIHYNRKRRKLQTLFFAKFTGPAVRRSTPSQIRRHFYEAKRRFIGKGKGIGSAGNGRTVEPFSGNALYCGRRMEVTLRITKKLADIA